MKTLIETRPKVTVAILFLGLATATFATTADLNVPADYPTIQAAVLCAVTAGLLWASRCIYAVVSLGVLLPTMLLAVDLDIQYLGAFAGSAPAYGVAVSGNFAYVAAGDAGFRVFDLTNHANAKLGECDTRGYAGRVAVAGNYVYVAEGPRYTGSNYIGGGLEVIDINDPANPHRIGEETNSIAWAVAVSGNYACVTSETNGFVIDISDPTNPRRIGSFDTSGYARLAAVGNFIYVADGRVGLQIIDISNPASPQRVGNYHAGRDVVDVAVRGNYAYLAEAPLYDETGIVGPGGLQVIDISDPTNPEPVGGYHQGEAHYVVSVSVDGNYACVFAVGLIDITDPSHPKLAAALGSPNDDLDQAVVSGNFVYVPDYAGGLHVYDFRAPANPQRIGSYEESVAQYISSGHQMAVSGDYAYVLEDEYLDPQGKRVRNSLQIIDISNSAQPRRVNDYDLSDLDFRNSPTALAVAGDYAYVTGYALGGDGARPGGGLQIIDVSNRTNPHLVSVWKPGWDTTALAVSGRYAYVGRGGLAVVDVGDPAAPQQVGIYNITNELFLHLTVLGGFAYMANWDAGMHVMDISDPTNPRRVGGYRAGYAYGVAVSGKYAYLAGEPRLDATNWVGGGLVILDISDPTAPKRVGGYGEGEFFSTVAVAGNYAYIENPWGGFQVIDVSNPAIPQRVGGNAAVSVPSIAISGDRLFAATVSRHGLAILDLFRPLRLEALSSVANTFRLRADGPRGVSVQLQRSTDLTEWVDWLPVILGPAPVEIVDGDGATAPRRFYRAHYP